MDPPIRTYVYKHISTPKANKHGQTAGWIGMSETDCRSETEIADREEIPIEGPYRIKSAPYQRNKTDRRHGKTIM